MFAQMLTSKQGAELLSFKVNGEEKIHQGENCVDENGKIYFKRQWQVLFPTVGKCKKNQTIINGKNCEMQPNGFLKDMEFEPVTKLDNFHSYIFKSDKKLIYDYETKSEMPLYVTDKISGLDPYDIYLGGPKALLKLHVPNSTSGKELVLFRDSFGSSIAPLLLDDYDTIYLVDLRYTTVDTAMALITPSEDCDVLFLYSMNVLNSGSLRTKVI